MLGPEESINPLTVINSHGPVGSTLASVEVSITQDVGPGVDITVAATGTTYRTRTSLQPASGPGQTVVADSISANGWAGQTAEAIRTASRQPGVTDVDLYIAAPLQVAVFLGWRLNAVGRVHIPSLGGQRRAVSASLDPASDMTRRWPFGSAPTAVPLTALGIAGCSHPFPQPSQSGRRFRVSSGNSRPPSTSLHQVKCPVKARGPGRPRQDSNLRHTV